MPSSEVIAAILQAGRQAAAQGQFERAINLFRRVQEGYPTAPERSVATMLLAQTLERRRDIASALNEYRRLVAEFPQSPQAVLARAKIADLERQLPVARPPGMQLLGMYVEPEGLASLDEREFNRVRQSGTNTVVVGVTQHRPKAGVYFKTDWAPVLQDRLAAVVGAVHQQSLQIWAALSVRRMDWVDPALEWADWRYDPGTRRLDPADTLDLLHPALPDYLVGLITDLAATGIDGLLLLADPPSAANEGFSPHALRRYEREVGQALDPRMLWLRQGQDQTFTYAPEFWRWVGYFMAEGYAYEANGSYRVSLWNTDPEIRADYLALSHALFGVTPPGEGARAMLEVILPWFCIGTAAMANGMCRAAVRATAAHVTATSFEHTGTQGRLYLRSAARFEDHGFDPRKVQQMREHQSRGPRTDDADLRASGYVRE